MPKNEKITLAAIRVIGPGNRIAFYFGKRHGDVIQEIPHYEKVERIAQDDQGFWTNLGRFVDRVEARAIAITAGQIDADTRSKNKPLLSEELW